MVGTVADEMSSLLPSLAMRELSKRAFGRESQVETGVAVTTIDHVFVFDELFGAVTARAQEAGLTPPSSSAVRKDVERMREVFGALQRVPTLRSERVRHETRIDGPFWSLCIELARRTQGVPLRK
jgi:hypothetical protein